MIFFVSTFVGCAEKTNNWQLLQLKHRLAVDIIENRFQIHRLIHHIEKYCLRDTAKLKPYRTDTVDGVYSVQFNDVIPFNRHVRDLELIKSLRSDSSCNFSNEHNAIAALWRIDHIDVWKRYPGGTTIIIKSTGLYDRLDVTAHIRYDSYTERVNHETYHQLGYPYYTGYPLDCVSVHVVFDEFYVLNKYQDYHRFP